MRPILSGLALAAGLLLGAAPPALASIEEGYVPGGTPAPTTWYRRADPAADAADRAYVEGMRAHHAGALTMSEAYLAEPEASSPALRRLARAIIRNQRFELALLEEVGRNLALPPLRLGGLVLQPVATEGLAQMAQFQRSPMPGALDAIATAAAPVTRADVLFAKAMILHPQGALDMVRDYRAGAGSAANGFLGLVNVDIVTDQTQEIGLMRRVIAAWPGDAAAVEVPPEMVHGMAGMTHGAMPEAAAQPAAAPHAADPHAGHAAAPAAARVAPAPAARQPRRAPEAHGHGHGMTH